MSTGSVVGVFMVRLEGIYSAPVLFYIALFLFVIVVFIFVQTRVWFFARRRIIRQKITAEYEAPLGLNPAEISYLFKRQLDARDFAGLLTHMAQRGVVHFRKHEGKKVVLPGPRYDGKIKEYEKMILDVLDDHKNVPAADLVEGYKTIFGPAEERDSFTQHVRRGLIKSGYIRKKPVLRRTITLLKSIALLLSTTVWLPLFILWVRRIIVEGTGDLSTLTVIAKDFFTLSLVLFLPALVIVVFAKQLQARSVGRWWIIEYKLINFWPHIIGFRQFVYLSEHEKLDFDNPELKKTTAVHTLPYAIALGFVPNWHDIVT